MRFRLLSLLACCVFTLTFTSCIEEGASDLLISSESGLTQEQLDSGQEISTMAYGYLHQVNGSAGELKAYQLSLTASDVQVGDRLLGTSNMMVLNLMGYGDDITGVYRINSNEATRSQGIAFMNYCLNMNFATGTMDLDIPTSGGTVSITNNEEGGYTVSYSASLTGAGDTAGELRSELPLIPLN